MNATMADRLISGEGMLGTEWELKARSWGEAPSGHFSHCVRALAQYGGLSKLVAESPPGDDGSYKRITISPGIECGVVDISDNEVVLDFTVRFKCQVTSFYCVPRLNWTITPWQAYGGTLNGKGPLNERVDLMLGELVDFAVGKALGEQS
jgi:hypothetical protein